MDTNNDGIRDTVADLKDKLHNYNITLINDGTAEVTPADLTITVGDANTVYGQEFVKDNYYYNFGEEINDKVVNGLVNGDAEDTVRNELGIDKEDYVNNAAIEGQGDRVTAGVGNDYVIGLDTNNDGIRDTAEDLKDKLHNYNITFIKDGTAEVTPADLIITVGNASTEYGQKFDEKQYDYSFSTEANGDDRGAIEGYLDDIINGNYKNDAAYDGTNDKFTADAGTHSGAVGIDVNKDGSHDTEIATDGLENALKNYDINIVDGDATIGKAELTVTVGNANTEYGQKFDDAQYNYDFGAEANGDDRGTIEGYLDDIINGNYKNDAAYDGTNEKFTADAGTHSGAVGIDVNKDGSHDTEIVTDELENALKNYDINIVDGDATIGKAKLDVYVDNIKTEYGTAFDENKYGYTVKEEDLANGDKVDAVRDEIDNKNNISYENSADMKGVGGKWTADVGTYEDAIDMVNDINLKNYDVIVHKGDADVGKADLNIVVDDKNIILGEKPNYTGDFDGNQLKNGDKLEDFGDIDYAVVDENLETQPNIDGHKDVIGIVIGDDFYLKDEEFISKDIFKNYNVHIESGDLKVVPLSPEEESSKWGNLLNDAPWDRNRDFRERKAEFNYTDGGVAIEKNDEDIVVEA